MKSTIYSNYNVRRKFNGIIDYKSISVVTIIIFVIFTITNLFDLSYKISFIILCIVFPFISVILICNNKNESSLDIILSVLRFYLKAKLYTNDYKFIKKYGTKFNKIYVKKL